MSKRVNKSSPTWLVIIGLVSLALIIATLLRGNDLALLNPKGMIASEQKKLMILSVILLLEIAIPTLTLFYYIAWKYRESNDKPRGDPEAHHHKTLVFTIWALPFITMVLLASVMWPATHRLAPQKKIQNGNKPLVIQVIAMRWKWLFIYPEQQMATVNYIQIPVGTPIEFNISADEIPMSSFWIPHLGGQLYAMTGHVNLLNLVADVPGDYNGSNAEINGAGFAGMKFTARATSMDDFNLWTQSIKQSKDILDDTEYKKLLAPSEYNVAAFYAKAEPTIYATMLKKYGGSHQQHKVIE